MDAITNAIENIKYQIPRQILETAMLSIVSNTQPVVSLDERIRYSIIQSKVLVDCNIVGGIETNIELNSLTPTVVEWNNIVYNIPKTMTDNKSIISVLSAYLGSQTPMRFSTTYGVEYNSSQIENIAGRVQDSLSSIGPLVTAKTELIAENTVLIKTGGMQYPSITIRCVLENDPNLRNINPRSFIWFNRLCVLAAKAYIYNLLILELDRAYLHGGYELGRFANIVESYEGAMEEYNTFLREVWSKVSWMNDDERYNRFIKTMISPGL